MEPREPGAPAAPSASAGLEAARTWARARGEGHSQRRPSASESPSALTSDPYLSSIFTVRVGPGLSGLAMRFKDNLFGLATATDSEWTEMPSPPPALFSSTYSGFDIILARLSCSLPRTSAAIAPHRAVRATCSMLRCIGVSR